MLETGEPEITSGAVVFGGMDGNLYATVGSGSLVRLTDLVGARNDEAYGAYGWIGSRVVYATQAVNDDSVTGTIYSVEPGGTTRRLVRRRGFAPFFLYPSPDDSRVAYLGSQSGESGYLMGSVGADGRRDVLHGIGQPFYAAWSPDSGSFLTHVGIPQSSAGSSLTLQSVRALVAGDEAPAALEFETGSFQAPAFSPDGRSIAVALTVGGINTIAIIDREPGGGSGTGDVIDLRAVTRVTPLDGTAAMAWSPDGRRLAYVDGQFSATGGIVGKLFTIDPETRRQELISERVTTFFWSPDGTRILFLEPYVVGDNRNAGLLYRVGVHRLGDIEPGYVAIMRPAQAFVRQIVPFFDQYHRAYTIWSPDSRMVVLNASGTDGTPVIHLVDVDALRSGSQFSVSFSHRTQARPEDGLITEEGVRSRVLSYGTVPFFSHGDSGVLPEGALRPAL